MKIIHLSDLHFGTEEQNVLDALKNSIEKQNPDFLIVSGDFTQIGSAKEFQSARNFLDSLKVESLYIPGNHDVPARNLFERFLHPYKKYKKYIHPDLNPTFENKDVIIGGINSARRALPHWNWANGAVSQQQRDALKKLFKANDTKWKICTLHHPIHKILDMPIDVTVFGRKRTMQCFQDLKIDLVLTGHVHHASIDEKGDKDHKTIYVSASTALSSRLRGQENGYNLIALEDNKLTIQIYKLQSGLFEVSQKFEYFKNT